MITAISFFLILSLLILVHEGGHFLVAKKSGVKVEEFGFGIPPRIWGKKIGETVYSINLFPFGGFVRLYGEEGRPEKDKKRAFSYKSQTTKIAVILAGVIMNLILATILFCLVYSALGIPERGDQVKIVGLVIESPAAQAGLKEEDIIVSVAGEPVKNVEEFVSQTEKNLGQPVELQIERKDNPCRSDEQVLGGQSQKENYSFCQNGELYAVVVPRENPPEEEGALGVVISDATIKHYPFYIMIPKAIYNGFLEAYFWVKEMVAVLGIIVKSLWQGKGLPEGITGPVGIYQATEQVSQSGFWALVHFTGILSINLAVFNLIPFPALDGGRAVFVLSEKIIGVEKREKVERWANSFGMALLLIFLFVVTWQDVRRLFNF